MNVTALKHSFPKKRGWKREEEIFLLPAPEHLVYFRFLPTAAKGATAIQRVMVISMDFT